MGRKGKKGSGGVSVRHAWWWGMDGAWTMERSDDGMVTPSFGRQTILTIVLFTDSEAIP